VTRAGPSVLCRTCGELHKIGDATSDSTTFIAAARQSSPQHEGPSVNSEWRRGPLKCGKKLEVPLPARGGVTTTVSLPTPDSQFPAQRHIGRSSFRYSTADDSAQVFRRSRPEYAYLWP
jgi:hypothetical protein